MMVLLASQLFSLGDIFIYVYTVAPVDTSVDYLDTF